MAADDTARIDITPIHQAEIKGLEERYGVKVWFGHHTRHWWALDGDHLVEAATPNRLGEEIMGARRSDTQRRTTQEGVHAPSPSDRDLAVTEYFVPRPQ